MNATGKRTLFLKTPQKNKKKERTRRLPRCPRARAPPARTLPPRPHPPWPRPRPRPRSAEPSRARPPPGSRCRSRQGSATAGRAPASPARHLAGGHACRPYRYPYPCRHPPQGRPPRRRRRRRRCGSPVAPGSPGRSSRRAGGRRGRRLRRQRCRCNPAF